MLFGLMLTFPSGECEETGDGCTSHLVPLPLLGAVAFDAIFLSWATPEPRQAATPAVLPAIALTPGGGTLGVSGRF